jgi:hypothetical protein
MAIASNAVPAAITHVDARTGSEFTTASTILPYSSFETERWQKDLGSESNNPRRQIPPIPLGRLGPGRPLKPSHVPVRARKSPWTSIARRVLEDYGLLPRRECKIGQRNRPDVPAESATTRIVSNVRHSDLPFELKPAPATGGKTNL